MAGKLFIVSAPSGTGKTTLVHALLERLKNRFSLERVVTYTTKQPSAQEKNGQDYHFVSVSEFEEKIQQGFFMEWSGDYGAFYGSPAHVLERIAQGTSFILIIDRTGARRLVEAGHNPVLIWLKPANFQVLAERLKVRGRDAAAVIERRLELAQQELADEEKHSLYKHQVMNEDFEMALEKLEQIFVAELGAGEISIGRPEAPIDGLNMPQN